MNRCLPVFRLCISVLLCLSASAAFAQSLRAPAEFYFDEDRTTTQPVVVVKGEGDAVVDKLSKLLERDPRALEPRLQLAALAMKGGRVELGRSLYDRALANLGNSSRWARTARWNYGWDLHRAGDHAAALAQWVAIADNGGPIRGQWLPTTLAMALWNVGRKDEAVKWYAAAVRTYPDRWASPSDIAALLPEWSDADRATLIEVQHAWAANPPAWP